MTDVSDKRLYHFDEGVVSLPRGFRDRSTHTLEWSFDGGAVVLVIQRERLGWGTFDDFVRAETRDYPSEFLGYRAEEVVEFADPFEGALPLRRFAFRYKGEEDVLYHHQAFVFRAPLVLVFTVKANAEHRSRADALLAETLADLRFRED